MGRYLFWRTSLNRYLLILLAAFSGVATLGASGPLPPIMSPSTGTTTTAAKRTDLPYLIPRQNHAASKSWSVNLEDLANRPEISQWIAKWQSENGLTKLRIAGERSFDFRVEVDTIVRESGLPWEVIAIPIVESNWRINAVSHSGAAGPWQFLVASGRGRKLIIDAWRDDRRDVWRSTEAAMSELAFYDRLFSDWLMAAASYNAGPTRMRRLKLENNYETFWDMLDAGIIPPETQNYVPQVIAVAWVTTHAGRLGLPISWEAPVEWARIPSTRSVHLDELALIAGMSRQQIRIAHGELNHPITPPPTLPYMLKVPRERTAEVSAWLEELGDQGAPDRFWRYSVQSGDTLSQLAERYDISLSELLSYNGHVRSGILRIGERLYLPGTHEEPPGVEPDELPVWTGSHTVIEGESFWSIARSYDVSPELLAEINNRSMNGILQLGNVLRVPANLRRE